MLIRGLARPNASTTRHLAAGFAEAGFTALKSLPQCTAILCEDALTLARTLTGATVELAGFEAAPQAEDSPLAAMAVFDFEQLGNSAMDLLLGRLKEPNVAAQRVLLPPEIRIKTGSTKCEVKKSPGRPRQSR